MADKNNNVNDATEISMLEAVGMLANGYSLAELKGIDLQKLEALYALAYQYYQAQNYQDAKNIFQALCLFEPSEQKYFMGLASCEQGLKNYSKAADVYSVCCVLSGLKDPKPMYYAGVCLLKAGRKEDAKVAFQSLEIMGREGKSEDQEFILKGKQLLAVLEPSKS